MFTFKFSTKLTAILLGICVRNGCRWLLQLVILCAQSSGHRFSSLAFTLKHALIHVATIFSLSPPSNLQPPFDADASNSFLCRKKVNFVERAIPIIVCEYEKGFLTSDCCCDFSTKQSNVHQ
jgi:hypothetical protein